VVELTYDRCLVKPTRFVLEIAGFSQPATSYKLLCSEWQQAKAKVVHSGQDFVLLHMAVAHLFSHYLLE
jgi:hypothetical protein